MISLLDKSIHDSIHDELTLIDVDGCVHGVGVLFHGRHARLQSVLEDLSLLLDCEQELFWRKDTPIVEQSRLSDSVD